MSELLYSPTAVERRIWNGAAAPAEGAMRALVENVLDPLRERYGKKILVSSGYRCPQLNRLVGGSTTSQHMAGEAADICTEQGPEGNLELARLLIDMGRYDQIILEHVPGHNLLPQWVHVSFRLGGRNRHEVRKKVIGSNSYPLLTASEMKQLKV